MKNIYKKVLTLAMGLVFSVSAFAQANFNTIEVKNDVQKFVPASTFGVVDASKYVSESSKAAGVTISVVETATTTATFHFDMNEETYAYFTIFTNPGAIEAFASQNGLSNYEVFAYLASQNAISGYMTDTTVVVGGLTPGDTVAAYALALASEEDTVGALVSQIAVAQRGEATGTAEVTVVISNVTTSSFDIEATMNEHTAYYYMPIYDAANLEGYSFEEIVQNILANVQPYSENAAGTVGDLDNGATYHTYVLPYNAAGEMGVHQILSTTVGDEVSIFTATGVNFSIYPNPATSVLNVNGENVERVELYNALGQQVMSENGAAQLDVNGLAKGAYILKVYSNGKVGSQKVIVK